MNYDAMLLNLAKMVGQIQIPNIMNASDTSLTSAREQKDVAIKEIHRIRKLMKEENEI